MAFGIAGTRIGGAGTYGVAERAMSGGLWYMWWYAINTFLAIAIVPRNTTTMGNMWRVPQ